MVQYSPFKLQPNRIVFKGTQGNHVNKTIDIINFKVIDDCVSRGSQPTKQQLEQLKKNGYSTVINFRTMFVSAIDYDEKKVVEDLGMKYYNLPIISADGPSDEVIEELFKIIEQARKNKQKVFIHCKQGQDRTGFMSALYRLKYGLGKIQECVDEMIQMGHNRIRYPNMISKLRVRARTLFPESCK